MTGSEGQVSSPEVHGMNVSEVMTKNPIVVSVNDKVRLAAGLLKKNRIGGLPVMDNEVLVGMVTDTDIVNLLETGRISDDLWLPSPLEIIEVPIREMINWEKTKKALTHIGDEKVEKIMSHPAITIEADVDIEEAAALMHKEQVARLPVLKGRKLVGIITHTDIVQGIGSSFEGTGP
jgi:CBS domain-containing protein